MLINRPRETLLPLIMASLFVLVGSGMAADIESTLTEINRKPPEERSKILMDGARKERVVSYYGSTSMSDLQDLFKDFNQKYPFIEVRYTRLGAPALISKISSEYQGGVYNADVVSVRGTLFPELISKQIVTRSKNPPARLSL